MFNDLTWKDGEKKVQEFMKRVGYKILVTNYSCVGVELDIVAILPRGKQIKDAKNDYKNKIKEADKETKYLLKKSMKNYLKTLKDILVITEVKARSSEKFGTGADAIGSVKMNNILRGAKYLQTDNKLSKYPLRFDVASVDNGKITYIEGAF